ncbi:MAG: hypothetical protein ACN4GR_06710 [Arenicellales bacterium]
MDTGHLLKWKGYFNIWKKSPRFENGIWVMNPFSPVPIRDVFPFNTCKAILASYKYCLPSIRALLKRGGILEPDILWAAKPGSSVLKKLFPDAKLIMQVVDYYPAFRGDYIKNIERRDYEAADHIFLIGHALLDYVTSELGIDSKKVSILGQGVSLDNYTNDISCPEELKLISGPRAVWVGVLDKADADMFEKVAISLHGLGGSLILIGPSSVWATDLSTRLSNVYLLGSKDPTEVPAYLLHSEIGLMLYDQNKSSVYYGQNPLKLYEYAAAGLSILSTPHREFEFLNPPVIEVNSSDEVASGINRALAERCGFRKKSLDFAQEHDWAKVYATARDKILGIIGD